MLGATQQQLFEGTPTEGGGYDITGFRPYQPYSTNVNDYFAGFSPLQQQAQQGVADSIHEEGFAPLKELITGAPPADETIIIEAAGSRSLSDRTGFVEIACERLLGTKSKAVRRDLIMRAARTLKTISALKSRPSRRR